MIKKIYAADLFCGAGGTSEGLEFACQERGLELELLAINHWDVAIATHTINHPEANHLCENLDNVNPKKVVPSGYLDILVASPECTHHSNARGGRPMSDQSRASAWHVLRWAEALRVKNILVENVKEFENWGPLGSNGRPLKSKKGELFKAFINSLKAMGYNVDHKILNAANYGDATTRQRLFILARKGKKVEWPAATHTPNGDMTLLGKTLKWRTAREIIDWNVSGKSIFERKKPLSDNTMRRIIAGLRKFSGKELEPFLVKLYKTSDAADIDKPVPTLTTVPKIGLCQPFLVEFHGDQGIRERIKSIDNPLPTVGTSKQLGICQPFLVEFYGNGKSRSVDNPLPTQSTKDRFGVVEPFIVRITQTGSGDNAIKGIDKPLPTIMTKEELVVCQPFIVPNFGERDKQKPRVHSIDKPIPAVTSAGAGCLVTPMIIPQQSCGIAHSIDEPMPTIATKGAIALAMPEYDGKRLDIKFRMLLPDELARAMSFNGYHFEGRRVDVVKQIGNAVPVNLAKHLCLVLL